MKADGMDCPHCGRRIEGGSVRSWAARSARSKARPGNMARSSESARRAVSRRRDRIVVDLDIDHSTGEAWRVPVGARHGILDNSMRVQGTHGALERTAILSLRGEAGEAAWPSNVAQAVLTWCIRHPVATLGREVEDG